ncbi:sulfur carrier protein ThiS [Microbulbifer pacificus]|uniref:Sulfur carrier protein ThiS n=1 Tax=Microbulbifer pacificus TaxID=407164 RepID=A0AAU0MY06_9GAMM|nr:sulfur carrier protein ThiS [Microbulbifer pacificus]WOX05085.1 sulfur carrier protein ThiS [Microbulbifer pacificus]
MQLVVNGESTFVQHEQETIADLLQQLGYSGDTFAVALNGDFVPRASYAETHLNSGDKLDIVAPVVGG